MSSAGVRVIPPNDDRPQYIKPIFVKAPSEPNLKIQRYYGDSNDWKKENQRRRNRSTFFKPRSSSKRSQHVMGIVQKLSRSLSPSRCHQRRCPADPSSSRLYEHKDKPLSKSNLRIVVGTKLDEYLGNEILVPSKPLLLDEGIEIEVLSPTTNYLSNPLLVQARQRRVKPVTLQKQIDSAIEDLQCQKEQRPSVKQQKRRQPFSIKDFKIRKDIKEMKHEKDELEVRLFRQTRDTDDTSSVHSAASYNSYDDMLEDCKRIAKLHQDIHQLQKQVGFHERGTDRKGLKTKMKAMVECTTAMSSSHQGNSRRQGRDRQPFITFTL